MTTVTASLDPTTLQDLDFDLTCQVDNCESGHAEPAAYLARNKFCGCSLLLCPSCVRHEITAMTLHGLDPLVWTCKMCDADSVGRLIDLVEVRPL